MYESESARVGHCEGLVTCIMKYIEDPAHKSGGLNANRKHHNA